ncbi:sulfotransferase domain-containing protein [Chelativorans sp. AA-79]|uniref:sulfotransferase domain-containing protein n=1 Tax=Chelativorans sp. AA-79 TaxID=3028735 RepID=UPI0023F93221|nr:sulfotransferase domain-containing protein [Chelativorans sp. AA-79]WEX10239.1 sulfotransferase [Chelativorans sp. AA-79]
MRPRLYINAGAMKAGTTWLLHLLKSNKRIMTTPVKEVDYFSYVHTEYKLIGYDARKGRVSRIISSMSENVSNKELSDLFSWLSYYLRKDIDDYWYYSLFQNYEDAKYIADLSNTYCHLPVSGWEHVKKFDPDTRITFIMRDPVQRTLSHLKFEMMFSGQNKRIDRISNKEILDFAKKTDVYKRSSYSETINNILSVFPREQFRYYIFEEIMSDKDAFAKDLSEFLGVKIAYSESLSKSINEGPQKKFSRELLGKLTEAYEPIYAELQDLLGTLPPAWAVNRSKH